MKAFVFLPDGVGLRNFTFSNFHQLGIERDIDIVYWNNTGFPLEEIGLNDIKFDMVKPHPVSDLYKRSRSLIELKLNEKRFSDKTYRSYVFKPSFKGVKNFIKSTIVMILKNIYASETRLEKLKMRLFDLERTTQYYKSSLETLKRERPSVVFLTNQRPLTAIGPLLAAQDLGIPTITFIFSWDNLPKGMMVVKSDYYFVWSEHMKQELLKYYPNDITTDNIFVTGTPQFELHYDKTLIEPKEVFFTRYSLDLDKKYICFSGDDITTSPNDQFYLRDTAQAVRSLNKKGYNLGIIYRKCPVDFTDRHIKVYEEYRDVITLIDPLWKNLGNGWDKVMPTQEDMKLLANTVKYTDMVINVGSSMVFDYVAQGKSCAYLNYNTKETVNSNWDINSVYKFIHFKSMPSKEAVLWINTASEIEDIIVKGIERTNLEQTIEWYQKICGNEPMLASENIWKTILRIAN